MDLGDIPTSTFQHGMAGTDASNPPRTSIGRSGTTPGLLKSQKELKMPVSGMQRSSLKSRRLHDARLRPLSIAQVTHLIRVFVS